MIERRLTAEYLEDVLEAAEGPFEVPADMLRDALHDLSAADAEIADLQKSRAKFYEAGCRIHDRWEKLKVRLREAKQGGGRPDQVMLTTIDAVQEMMDELDADYDAVDSVRLVLTDDLRKRLMETLRDA